MQENLRIVQALNKITPGPFKVDDHKLAPLPRATMKESMKLLTHHFKVSSFPFPVMLSIDQGCSSLIFSEGFY